MAPPLEAPAYDHRIVPFLKWAGGKRWFTERFMSMIPASFNRYVEPFVGSGAVFFALKPKSAQLSDLNADLISCYLAVKRNPLQIARLLEGHQRKHSDKYYYQIRAKKPRDPVELAAWFIYLNRTCWNGLYRVNARNEFNVPKGTKTKVVLPTDNFEMSSVVLASANILHQDFEKALEDSGDGDFVFVDPPYTVKHNLNGFIKYNDRIFSWSDQVRLRDAVVSAARRGAMILVTNANHESIRDLYGKVGRQEVVDRASVLSADPAYRARTEELTIRTWL